MCRPVNIFSPQVTAATTYKQIMSDWIDKLDEIIWKRLLYTVEYYFSSWGNSVALPTCPAPLFGLFAISALGISRERLLNRLSDDATTSLEEKDVERLVSSIRSLDACDGFQRSTTVYAMNFKTDLSAEECMQRARALFGVDYKQMPVWNGTDPVEPSLEDEEREDLDRFPEFAKEKRENFTRRLYNKHLINAEIGKMKGEASNMISTGDMDEHPSLVVMNSVNFTFQWKYPMKRLKSRLKMRCYKQRTYYSELREAILCDTPCKYIRSENLDVVQIPYKEEGFSFVLLVPELVDFQACRNQIKSTSLLRDIMEDLKWYTTNNASTKQVVLPSFKVPFEQYLIMDGLHYHYLNKPLTTMGGGLKGLPKVFLNHALQTVHFKVEANSYDKDVYSLVPKNLGTWRHTDPYLIVNSPFFYMVWNEHKRIPLLFGQMCWQTEPTNIIV